MKGQLELLFDSKGEPFMSKNLAQEPVHVGFCKKTGDIYSEKGFYVIGYRNYLEGDEQGQIWDRINIKTERSKFDKAKKVKWGEFKADSEQFFDGEDYYQELDDFFDSMIEAHGYQYDLWQDYLWPTKPEQIISKKDASDVYQSELGDITDEYDWDVKGVEDLQIALDEFVSVNEKTIAYFPDYSTALVIGDQIEEFKKQHED